MDRIGIAILGTIGVAALIAWLAERFEVPELNVGPEWMPCLTRPMLSIGGEAMNESLGEAFVGALLAVLEFVGIRI